MKPFTYINVIRDTYDRVCIVTGKTESEGLAWEYAQEKPFSVEPDFYRAYPVLGGSIIVDLNQCIIIGQIRSDAIEAILEFCDE